MRELLRVCLLPWILSNLIDHACCAELHNDNGISGSNISTASLAASGVNASAVTASSSVTSTLSNATCLSRTVNYITHTLPQQCLRTDRIAVNAMQNSTVTGSQSGNISAVPEQDSTVSGSTTSSHQSSATATDGSPSPPKATNTGASSTTEPSVSAPEPEAESDSPLDNARFLSFEEWKKQNLAKSGQSAENIGKGSHVEGIRERPINNALESYGEEGEIDLDFSGFGREPSAPRSLSRESKSDVGAVDVAGTELAPALRSKDAGKTCKERTNYASFDCAANVLKSNPECKSSSAVLVENKDTYMLNTCSASNKFFIVELCDNILIDTVVLANYEFFSSMFRHFRVSVSDRYPVKIDKWTDLGTFEARNVREVQAFLVERPQIWARYLRIEFLTHYGSEYYCPVSLLRVHGTTMLEDYRHQEEIAGGDHSEDATLDVEVNATPALSQEPAASTDERSKETVTAIEDISAAQAGPAKPTTPNVREILTAANSTTTAELPSTSPALNATFLLPGLVASGQNNLTCASEPQPSSPATSQGNNTGIVSHSTSASQMTAPTSSTATAQDTALSSAELAASFSALRGTHSPAVPTSESRQAPSASSSAPVNSSNVDESSQVPSSAHSANASVSNSSTASSAVSTPASSSSKIAADNTRQSSTSSMIAAAPHPATQESFYKSVHKRLQQLESNSTLSLQYIEEQSRILRDAFSKVEKRQIAATTSFLSNLNSTVMTELQGFRQAYDQLWQSTVIELEGQREQYQREMLAMGTRLTLVADELVWQKRMGIVQSTLLLLCLGLVLFARQGNGYLEMPLMQQMVHRSQTALARAGWESPPASPSPNSRSPVSLFRRKLWRSHTEPVSGNVTEGADSRPESKDGPGLEVNVAPPTPPDDDAAVAEVSESEEGDTDFEDVWESRSGPATPRGTREGSVGEGVGWLDPGASGTVVECGLEMDG